MEDFKKASGVGPHPVIPYGTQKNLMVIPSFMPSRAASFLLCTGVIALWLLRRSDRREGFFGMSPRVCAKVKAAKYPQIHLDNVLDQATCSEIIKDAEAYAESIGGWQTDRHDDYPTTDLDTADIPTLKFPVHNLVYRTVVPKIARAYHLDSRKLGISEVFIAKYSAAKGQQRSLDKHVDGSDFSFVIALNDDFTGGGTKFIQSKTIKKPTVGSAVAFCGQSKHRGLPITSGTRYIMAGFLTYETPDGCHSQDNSAESDHN